MCLVDNSAGFGLIIHSASNRSNYTQIDLFKMKIRQCPTSRNKIIYFENGLHVGQKVGY